MVVLFHCHGSHQLADLRKPFHGCDLPLLDLMHHVGQLLKQLDLFRMGGRKLDGVDTLAKLNDRRAVPGGVLQQILQPRALQPQANAEHQVCIRNLGHVSGARLVGVRVRANGQQAEHLDVVAADVADPVSHNVVGGHHVQPGFRRPAVGTPRKDKKGQQAHRRGNHPSCTTHPCVLHDPSSPFCAIHCYVPMSSA